MCLLLALPQRAFAWEADVEERYADSRCTKLVYVIYTVRRRDNCNSVTQCQSTGGSEYRLFSCLQLTQSDFGLASQYNISLPYVVTSTFFSKPNPSCEPHQSLEQGDTMFLAPTGSIQFEAAGVNRTVYCDKNGIQVTRCSSPTSCDNQFSNTSYPCLHFDQRSSNYRECRLPAPRSPPANPPVSSPVEPPVSIPVAEPPVSSPVAEPPVTAPPMNETINPVMATKAPSAMPTQANVNSEASVTHASCVVFLGLVLSLLVLLVLCE
jgi:hypothetical protein